LGEENAQVTAFDYDRLVVCSVQQRNPAGTDSHRGCSGGYFYQYTNFSADRPPAHRRANQYAGSADPNIYPHDQTNSHAERTDVYCKIW
jgi:hypothetical protein